MRHTANPYPALGLAITALFLNSPSLSAAESQQAPATETADWRAIESDWRAIPADELLVMDLAGGRRVIIRLAGAYTPEHVANVRALARARWWDGTTVYRVQDNWVTQWGGAGIGKQDLPPGVQPSPAAEFEFQGFPVAHRLERSDAYSAASGLTADGWAIASNGTHGWLAHCYGTVAVAHGQQDTGSGAELFVSISSRTRRIDRDFAIVGLVIEGMHHLSSLPRADGGGFYETVEEQAPIVSVRLGSEVTDGEPLLFEYRATDNERYAALIEKTVNAGPPARRLGGIDVCDVPLETRRVEATQ